MRVVYDECHSWPVYRRKQAQASKEHYMKPDGIMADTSSSSCRRPTPKRLEEHDPALNESFNIGKLTSITFHTAGICVCDAKLGNIWVPESVFADKISTGDGISGLCKQAADASQTGNCRWVAIIAQRTAGPTSVTRPAQASRSSTTVPAHAHADANVQLKGKSRGFLIWLCWWPNAPQR